MNEHTSAAHIGAAPDDKPKSRFMVELDCDLAESEIDDLSTILADEIDQWLAARNDDTNFNVRYMR